LVQGSIHRKVAVTGLTERLHWGERWLTALLLF
jgi:hypothetical protein